MIGVDTPPYSCSDTDSDGFENFVSFLSTSEVANGSAVDDAPKLSSKKEEASKSSIQTSSSRIPSKAVGVEKALVESAAATTTGHPGDLEAGTQTPSAKPDPFLIKAFQDADTDGDGHLSREELKVSGRDI